MKGKELRPEPLSPMQEPLDPISVERSETPSASYLLRRRYGTARYVIVAVSWLTVFSLLFQPVAILAGTWSSIDWTGDNDLPLSSAIEYTAAVDFKSPADSYPNIAGVLFQQSAATPAIAATSYAPGGITLGTWEIKGTGWSAPLAANGGPSGIDSDKLRDRTQYGTTGSGKQTVLGNLMANTDYIFSFYAPQYDSNTRGVTLTVGSDTISCNQKSGSPSDSADIMRYTYTSSGNTLTVGVSFTGSGGVMGAFTHEMPSFKYWNGGTGTWDTGTTANFGQRTSSSPSLRVFTAGKDAVFETGTQTVSVSGTVSPGTMQITGGTTTFSVGSGGAINATTLQITGGTSTFSGGAVSATTLSASGSATATFNNTVTAATADFFTATASTVVNTGSAGKLSVTGKMYLPGGYNVEGGFGVKSVSGSNIADNGGARTIVLETANGTVTLKKPVAPTGNLQRYWSFNDSAAPWKENSGAGVSDGTAVNGVAWMAAGKFGGGMNEGRNYNAYLNLATGGGTPPSFATGSQWTVSAWYNNISNVANDYRTLFRDISGVNPASIPILLNTGTYTLGTYGGSFQTSGYTLSDAQKTGWHFIAAVGGEGGANTTKFYIDGTLVGTANGKINTTLNWVGGFSGGQRFADGLDEVYAYNRALNSTEITQLMNATGVGTPIVDLQTTHISATANSNLDLADVTVDHKLGDITVTAGTGADTILTVDNVNSLRIGTLTIGIDGAYYGKLDMGTKELTLGNGNVPKLAVTSVSPTVQACCVAVAKDGSFTGLHGNPVTDNRGKKWNVEVRKADGITVDANGPQLWLISGGVPGSVLMVR